MAHSSNLNIEEVTKFEKLADEWWNLQGPCAPLHHLNPCRLAYVQKFLPSQSQASILDIGCGAGILSEALAKQTHHITGIDACQSLIHIAQDHAQQSKLSIHYLIHTAESLSALPEYQGRFDHITCMELLEHVPNPVQLLHACYTLLKPGGKLFLSTINRTPKAYAFAIIAAEYIFKLLPQKTHDYNSFIKPFELSQMLSSAQFLLQDITGISYNPLLKTAQLSKNTQINYLAYAIKQ